jgi:hypothetical protein
VGNDYPRLVALSHPIPGADVSVSYAVSGGTATQGDDFTCKSGTITIPAGRRYGYVPISIVNDGKKEMWERIELSLSAPRGASLGNQSRFTYTIQDNNGGEPAPVGVRSALGLVARPRAAVELYDLLGRKLATIPGRGVVPTRGGGLQVVRHRENGRGRLVIDLD